MGSKSLIPSVSKPWWLDEGHGFSLGPRTFGGKWCSNRSTLDKKVYTLDLAPDKSHVSASHDEDPKENQKR